MSWLAGWDHRMKWTADSSDTDKVTATITKPSIPIFFGSSVGKDDDDNTPIFDEIGSNSEEMAITYGDTEELYVEVESWASVAKTGVAWIGDNTDSSWTVVSGTDRTGWIYYKDGNQNTDRVGVIGSANGQKVWDSGHVMVQHMSQDPSGDAPQMIDSTGTNDGTSSGTMLTGDLVPGQIGEALDFDGDDDYINVDNDDSLNMTDKLTLEAWVEPDAIGVYEAIITKSTYVASPYSSSGFILMTRSGAFGFQVADDGYTWTEAGSISINTMYYLAGAFNGSTTTLYVDGAFGADESNTLQANTNELRIGQTVHSDPAGGFFNGIIDEVRVSNVARAAAWIKANYYFQDDNLLYFGSEERLFIPQVIIF